MELLNLSEKPQKIEGAPLSIVELHTGSKSPKIGFEKGCRLYLQGARKKKEKETAYTPSQCQPEKNKTCALRFICGHV